MIPSPDEFLADFNRLPVVSWLNNWHDRLSTGFVGWIVNSPAVALPLVTVYMLACLTVCIYATCPEWLGLRGPATMAGKPAATSVKVSQGVVPSVKEGSDGPSEKASLKLVEHPAAHAGEGGAPTFADAVKKRPYGSA